MPPVFPGVAADTLEALADKLQLPRQRFVRTVTDFNNACRPGSYDHHVLDDCTTERLEPVKSHWARPLNKPPYYAYALRPGITFTYLGLKTDATAAVHFDGQPSPNLFVAGEMMAGNILGEGYTGGIGMAIGTVFGRLAGENAAQSSRQQR
jgi:tricarballylate dehydrogenase